MAKEQEPQIPQEENVDKRKQRKEAKEKKRAEKKEKQQKDELEEESSGGGKIAMFFVTVMIIVVWLAIIALLIKWDVGGFGSTVMTPILKDVPYLNRILPDTGDEEELQISDEYSQYQTIDAAVARIKELEKQLQEAQDTNANSDAKTKELKTEVKRLSQYEQEQKKFEEEKAKYYEEVVFGDQAPDISEYKKYYDEIDPANAEKLYKQVVKQEESDQQLQDYVKMYSNMKPKEAAAIFDTMTDNLKLVAKILDNMSATSSSSILGAMDKTTAAKVTEIMEPKMTTPSTTNNE